MGHSPVWGEIFSCVGSIFSCVGYSSPVWGVKFANFCYIFVINVYFKLNFVLRELSKNLNFLNYKKSAKNVC